VFERDVLIADVNYNFDVFGYRGLSLWLVSATWPLDPGYEFWPDSPTRTYTRCEVIVR